MTSATLLLALASLAAAQYGPGGGPGGNNPYAGGDPGAAGGFGGFDIGAFLSALEPKLIAHGVLASLAFVIFFPLGAIMIRIASFPGLWWVHGLFQVFAYALFTAAVGLGIWFNNQIPDSLLDHYHPVIGLLCFALLFFQPILGVLHHTQFKKYNRRTFWSYGHLWLGRIVITLGMINGGLGMLLATETGFFVPSRGQMIAYGVIAGLMWVAWVLASVFGEVKRSRGSKKTVQKEQYA
ncbi:hypothetical protein EJ04DRAFT_533729 [Polyplosphaeria fusca]|uniref:Cytochrome b561 domain-containing protein n=1 Tax=Polyplosphaeria fusca TaxID=682080 RepID=A0A9P4R1E1_9PLEO|nr:hypothetical protein EJ04DRAFT_533729 [Polyplosphaeria fusca]